MSLSEKGLVSVLGHRATESQVRRAGESSILEQER